MTDPIDASAELQIVAQNLADDLKKYELKIVFAESCTGGLLASTLSRIPGISNHLCGSAVTYRNATKTSWLGVDAQDLASQEIGPVSETVAQQMASGVLQMTPEADIAASITGHLGPDAPDELDGIAYSTITFRMSKQIMTHQLVLPKDCPKGINLRHLRQMIVANTVLKHVQRAIQSQIAS